MVETYEQEQNVDKIQQLNEALDSGMFVHVRMMLNDMPPSDVAHLLESSPPRARNLLWKLVNVEREGDILNYLNDEIRNNFVDQMAPQQLAQALEGLEIDDLADILGELPESVYLEVMASMSDQDRHRIEAALVFPEDTAGGLMNIDTITVRPKVTIDVVLRYLRMKGLPDSTDSIYVVDTRDRLLGAVSLATLITSRPESIVEDVLNGEVETINASTPANEVAQIFERRDLLSAPVTDDENRLLGRITIDDVVDVIREEAEHSLMSMAGLDETDDTFAPVWSSAKRRAIWLGINLLTVLVAAQVIGLFEETIKIVTALAILQPIVPSMGGVAGTQTLTLVIRGMSLGHVVAGNSRWLIMKELGVSLINGLLWALCVGTLTYFWFSYTGQSLLLAIAIAGAMVVNLVVGVFAGATLPMTLKKFNIDPALSGGVILTTITDVVGFFTLLGFATLFFA
ncbi:magnesium transporter [Pleionea litopenaei]|uniref:Magnesium transporter MgtE n=1 Tax=Pleionea litopenaei TaxID=3070815 RepID=A0AA51RTC4_9GAMM|nr:magnesium transporter [Pleionea sp. HL-JVS1]WMS87109.1 magnesium transporter [Pleionea sp. HL-JVS1]